MRPEDAGDFDFLVLLTGQLSIGAGDTGLVTLRVDADDDPVVAPLRRPTVGDYDRRLRLRQRRDLRHEVVQRGGYRAGHHSTTGGRRCGCSRCTTVFGTKNPSRISPCRLPSTARETPKSSPWPRSKLE